MADVRLLARPLVKDFIKQVFDTERITLSAVKDFALLPQSIEVMEALHVYQYGDDASGDRSHIEQAKEMLPLVDDQRSRGFVFFYGSGAIRLWSMLEAFVEDVLLVLLKLDPTTANAEAVQKVRVPLSEYGSMNADQRAIFLLDSIQRDVARGRQVGVAQFESVLKALNLGGAVDDEMRACLVELSAVRHVLVHRRGLVDHRFLGSCDWMGVDVGTEVLISRESFHMYSRAAISYSLVVYRRLMLRDGHSTTSEDKFLAVLKDRVIRSRHAFSRDHADSIEPAR
jgi:hypothetical protein